MNYRAHDALRREYNAAVSNGLIVRARRIERRLNALNASVTPPASTEAVPDERA